MLWLIRHGETEWSLSGAHTGVTDLPLTAMGEDKARALAPKLAGHPFELVLTSPRIRARRTCELAGLANEAQIDPNLAEWNYGEYEGRTTDEIREERPGWTVYDGGIPGGETLSQVAARALDVLDRVSQIEGDVAIFSHSHFLKIFAACWLNLQPDAAKHLLLGTASISKLGYDREFPVIASWNVT